MTGDPLVYDVAVSFAGAQRDVVEQVVRACQRLGLRVFYDKDNTVEFWGRNFIYGMREIYGGTRARYFMPFLSAEYLASAYPMDEFQAATVQAIAVGENDYILPVIVGSVQVPTALLSPAIGFLEMEKYSADELAEIVARRVEEARGSRREPEVVARTAGEMVRSAVPGISRVPLVPPDFVGREQELRQLDALLTKAGGAAIVPLHGLGGVGKSTLAAAYVREHADRFTLVWWMTADSPSAIETGLADLAARVAPDTLGLQLEQRVQAGVRWLTTHSDWLLVLDNLATPADADFMLSWTPRGSILITSRLATGWRVPATLAMDMLSPASAEEMLTRRVHAASPDADLEGVTQLCEELGYLPLAIEQAAAYIAQTCVTPARYCRLLADYPAEMFVRTVEGQDERRTMARIWHVTLDRLATTPLAADILRRMAWYAPDDIPRQLLRDEDPETPDTVHALGRLAAYHMIKLTADTASVHRLVQAVTRTPDPHDSHRHPDAVAAALHAATAGLARTARTHNPRQPESRPHYESILPHAQALLTQADPETDTGTTCLVFHGLGNYLLDRGNLPLALACLQRDYHSTMRIYGPLSADAVVARAGLAGVYMSMGRHGDAADLCATNLAVREQNLGVEHPATLRARDELGVVYQAAGELNEALATFEANMVTREQVLGADHPDTFISRGRVATVLIRLGDFARAIALLEMCLVHSRELLGPDHRDTLDVCNNLGCAYRDAGDPERAIPLLEATVASYERVLQAEHPHTIAARKNLARAYTADGHAARAIPLLETNRVACESVLGSDDPYTLAICADLAVAYLAVGAAHRALPLLETILPLCEQSLPADHPMIGDVRENLRIARDITDSA